MHGCSDSSLLSNSLQPTHLLTWQDAARHSSTQENLGPVCLCCQALYCAWLFLTGGSAVLKMAVGYLLGEQKRVVQGGLDSRALEYHVIVAKKEGN